MKNVKREDKGLLFSAIVEPNHCKIQERNPKNDYISIVNVSVSRSFEATMNTELQVTFTETHQFICFSSFLYYKTTTSSVNRTKTAHLGYEAPNIATLVYSGIWLYGI